MQERINQLKKWLNSKILGQETLVERIIVALLADGHLLVEGAPGLAKTKAIKTLSEGVDADFHRIQFTPDLLPADITGSDIYRPEENRFEFQAGPLFHNLILALYNFKAQVFRLTVLMSFNVSPRSRPSLSQLPNFT